MAPATGRAWLWTKGRLRALPAGLVLGVPSDLPAVARSGILSPPEVARAGLDLVLPARRRDGADRSVGAIVAGRFGRGVADRLVDPLLGGIHAGSIHGLSAAATAPQLDAAARQSRSLLLWLRGQVASSPPPTGSAAPPPVFLSHPEGLGRVVGALEARLAEAGVEMWLADGAVRLVPDGAAWQVTTRRGELQAEAVALCTPAPVTARLLSEVAPEAGRLVGSIRHASVVVTAMAYPRAAFGSALDGSGFLVPKVDGRLMTACTWTSSKWPHLSPEGLVLLRASAGHQGDDRAVHMPDDELVDALHGELTEAMGLRARPVETRITRWTDAFPQYTPGHLERVDRIDELVAGLPGLAVAGAAFRGVGIPACIAQGEAAAARLLAHLATPGAARPASR
ncbi:MAG TPA: protoporphyrinogen oxidase [Acidimicrobiales bacterium]|nr:protoporphyrinogen oxidase [Acidimicrobiales bacterium]